MMNKKIRLDIALVERGIVATRAKAQQVIKEGNVKVNGKICYKHGQLIKQDDHIQVNENIFPYVSRGGFKLEFALKTFKIDVDGKICLDIGSSTGGFTDCLLKHGAKLVYAVDVGSNQLHSSLRINPKVLYFENMDIRNFKLPENRLCDLICVDVSFISLTLIIPILTNFLNLEGKIIMLIKPQFEVGRKFLKKGVVKNENAIRETIDKIIQTAKKQNFNLHGIVPSPMAGKQGNREYFAYFIFSNCKENS